jgi:aryl-alcohol dehydrogenase-like predicted oxidoreductase
VRAAAKVAALTPEGATTAQLALRWIVDQPGVTTVIPGARSAEQARGNAEAALLPPLDDSTQDALRDIYDREVREHVHHRW